MWKWFDGKKSYIGMIILGILGILKTSGVDVPDAVLVAVGTLTGVAVRQAITKAEK